MVKRSRVVYMIMMFSVMAIGLVFKRFSQSLPEAMKNITGDALWALMIFFGFGFLFNKLNTLKISIISSAFCFLIEFSQLYHAEWIDGLRANRLGALILGNTFEVGDLFCYLIGIVVGILIEKYIIKMKTEN